MIKLSKNALFLILTYNFIFLFPSLFIGSIRYRAIHYTYSVESDKKIYLEQYKKENPQRPRKFKLTRC